MASLALVPDASVVAKWLLREPDSGHAIGLRDRFLAGEVDFVVPSLLYYEVANALRHRREVEPRDAHRFLEELYAYEMEEAAFTAAVAVEASRFARERQTTVYDATYLVVARSRNGVMVTADAKFEAKARSRHVATLARVHAELGR